MGRNPAFCIGSDSILAFFLTAYDGNIIDELIIQR